MHAKSFCVAMRLMVKHSCSVSSLGMRAGYTSTSQNGSDKAWSGATLRPQNRRRWGATICRQSHVDFILGLQRADLRALHAQRKHCDQCHLLKPEGKSEASYSPETARFVTDECVSPPRQCEATTYCYSNSVDY